MSSDPQVNFVDELSRKEWSYPVMNEDGVVVAKMVPNFRDVAPKLIWRYDGTGVNNRAVGNKTAPELCQALGSGWRVPNSSELLFDITEGARQFARFQAVYRWSSDHHVAGNNTTYQWSTSASRGDLGEAHLSCVREF